MVKHGMESLRDLCYTLRMMGVPLSSPSFIYGDNMSVIFNTQGPKSILKKKCNSICYHAVCELVVMGESITSHIQTLLNFSDLMTKVAFGQNRWNLVGGLLFDTYDHEWGNHDWPPFFHFFLDLLVFICLTPPGNNHQLKFTCRDLSTGFWLTSCLTCTSSLSYLTVREDEKVNLRGLVKHSHIFGGTTKKVLGGENSESKEEMSVLSHNRSTIRLPGSGGHMYWYSDGWWWGQRQQPKHCHQGYDGT